MPKTDQVFSPTTLLKLFTTIGLFPGKNIQVTSGTRNQARSESIIAVNPRDRNNLIAASKKFSNPETYRFTVGVRVTYDGGENWQDATLPMLPEWNEMSGDIVIELPGMTDPAAAFDDFGNAFMVGEPIHYRDRFGNIIDTIGMYIYKSTDGGLHWSEPFPLHVGDLSDDKSWIACDNNPESPFYGNAYIVWGAERSPLRFRRSTDHGASWKNFGSVAPEVQLADHTSEPEISVGLDGTVHIAWHYDGGNTIEYMRSTDGGETFEAQKPIVTGVHSLRGNLTEIGDPQIGKWPHFPGATFRVITLVTGCAFGIDPRRTSPVRFFSGPKNFAVAWSDFRDGAARIYYRTSSNAGASFEGPQEGKPLLGSRQVDLSMHHFHPQIVCTGSGVIGCAYYEYGPKGGKNLIDVKLSASFDKGETFSYTTTVTDKPWDPSLAAPNSHGDKQVTFIGEYFGLDADNTGFNVLWTDTRSGVQELFYDRVETERYDPPASLQGIIAEILFGVVQDGGGVIFVNGHFTPVPPRGPEFDLVQAMTALNAASKISGPAGRALTKSVYAAIGAIAKSAEKSVRGQ
jgi:hypothetical protein